MLRCPRCGRAPLIVQERILGYTPVVAIEDDGSLAFEGDTELVWEDSVSDADPVSGETLLFCRNAACPNFSGLPLSAFRRQLLGGPPTLPARPDPNCGGGVRP